MMENACSPHEEDLPKRNHYTLLSTTVNDLKEPSMHAPQGNVVKHALTPDIGPPSKKAKHENSALASCSAHGEKKWSCDIDGSDASSHVSDAGFTTSTCEQMETHRRIGIESGNSVFPPDVRDKAEVSERNVCEGFHDQPSRDISGSRHIVDAHETSPSHNSLRPDSIRHETTDSDDDRMDASNLVMSVIKTKVDIQTMKMCLRHNAEAFSSRSVSLPISAQSSGESTLPVPPCAPTSALFTVDHKSYEEPVAGPSGGDTGEQEGQGENRRYNSCTCNHADCQVCRTMRHSQLPSPLGVPDVPGQSAGLLEHWQDQHTAKAIVDNAINRTIEEMVIVPDPSRVDQNCEPESDLQGIQEQAVLSSFQRPMQTLQDRLEPVINQLTQASELVFARNIEHSRSIGYSDRQNDTLSPVDESTE